VRKIIFILLLMEGGLCLASGFAMETKTSIHQIYRDMQYIEAALWFILAFIIGGKSNDSNVKVKGNSNTQCGGSYIKRNGYTKEELK